MSSAMTSSASTTTVPGCARNSEIFQHRLIEEPPTSSSPAEERRGYAGLIARAGAVCAECPLAQRCLYDAVVSYDVSGYCGGTTRGQRAEMRRLLGIVVEPEDFDTLAGVQARNRQVDHDEVLRLRNANPHESLETIAHRLGCSLSTVKRHLRKARAEGNVTPIRHTALPTQAQVMRAYAAVVNPTAGQAARRRAA